jgi:polyisoprenoid-binding protein YceI
MFKVLVLICLGLFASASSLSVSNGSIQAHTEVFGDSEINPTTKEVKGELSIGDAITSLKGKIYFDTLSLISSKKDRDLNMYELLNATKYKTISFNINHVLQEEDKYLINGTLTLNGIENKISTTSMIIEENGALKLDGGFSILLSEYGMKPPTMFFLTVRDQIDITYNLELK